MPKMRFKLGAKKTDIHAASSSTSAPRLRKHQESAKHRFTDERKVHPVRMLAEGMSLSATAKVMGASVTTVSKWVKKGGLGDRASDAVSGVADKRKARVRPRVYCGV